MKITSVFRALFSYEMQSSFYNVSRRQKSFMFQKMIRVDDSHEKIPATTTFTILSYNCLASNLAEPQYFPYTDRVHLDFSYRSKFFEREFRSLNADIVCLQEMHRKDFRQWLSPFMSQLGYDAGTYAERGGERAQDGVVTFFKRDKFTLVSNHRVGYFDSAQAQFPSETSLATYNAALFCLLALRDNKTNVTNKEQSRIWVCNTHLNWNHTLPATQLFQIRTLFTELARLNPETENNSVVLVGDFNSSRDSVVYDYVLNGCLTTTSKIYTEVHKAYMPLFSGNSAKATEYLAECHPYRKALESAYNNQTFVMPFSTRIFNHFCDTIDHIFYQRDRMRPVQLFNALHSDSEQAARNDFTLPNEQHPSDHLPLMAEFALLSPITNDNASDKSQP